MIHGSLWRVLQGNSWAPRQTVGSRCTHREQRQAKGLVLLRRNLNEDSLEKVSNLLGRVVLGSCRNLLVLQLFGVR